jgi:signal transduction histidine kinase
MVTDLGVLVLKRRILLTTLYLFSHSVVYFSYWSGGLWQKLPQSWNIQFSIIFFFMLLLACITPFLKSVQACQGLFLLRLFIAWFLGFPFASHPGDFGLVYATLTLDGFSYFSQYTAYIPGALSLIYLTLIAYLQPSLWNNPGVPANFGSILEAWSQCIFGFIIGFYMDLERKRQNRLALISKSNQYLADTNVKLQDIAAHVKLNTTIRERTRIAREIHDTVAYTMTNLLSFLDVYRERLQSDFQTIPGEIIQARELVRDGLRDVRLVLHGLRPEEESDSGLGNVKRLVDVFAQATGIKVSLEFGNAPQFPGKDIEEVFYRVTQEGLTNAFRHGHATEVSVIFNYYKEGIGLTVSDNGIGTDTFSGGFGLLGIRERIGLLGGNINIISQVGNGFTLQIWAPLRIEEDTTNGTDPISNSR